MAISKEAQVGSLRATLAREHTKLMRQESAIEVTKAMIAMIEDQIKRVAG